MNTSAYDNQNFDDYPVVYVNWDMANAYCSWRGARLPTEAEWEKPPRARMDLSIHGVIIHPTHLSNFNNQAGAKRVGSYETARVLTEFYMAGNVWEWVSDWFQANHYATLSSNVSDPQGPDSGGCCVSCGGGRGP